MGKEKCKLMKKRLNYFLASKGAIIEYLEKKASEGYMLEKIEGTFYYFREEEPCKVKYSIERFDNRVKKATVSSETTEEYIESCKELGWNHVCSNGKIHYFYTKDDDAKPIKTDSKRELNYINKFEFLLSIICMCIYPVLMFVINLVNWIKEPEFYSAVDAFIAYDSTANIVCIGLSVLAFQFIIRAMVFNYRNKKCAMNGEKLIYFNRKEEKINSIITLLISIFIYGGIAIYSSLDTKLVMFILIIICVIALSVTSINKFIHKKSKLSKKKKIVLGVGIGWLITLIFMAAIFVVVGYGIKKDMPLMKNSVKVTYTDKKSKKEKTRVIRQDKLPLTAKDLSNVDKNCKFIDSWGECYKNLFGEFYECDESHYDKNMEMLDTGISYEILKTDIDFIKNSFIKVATDDEDGFHELRESKEEAKKWHADTVYLVDYNEADDYYYSEVIVYGDCVLNMHCASEDYVQDNIDLIYEKLVKND